MARRSRLRNLILLVFAAPFALLLGGVVVGAFHFLTFTDRWAKPTDFAAQHAALTRSQLGLAPSQSASTEQWCEIRSEVTQIHADRIPGFIDPRGVIKWPGELFEKDPPTDSIPLRDQLLADLQQHRIFERLDAIAADPRVVLEAPPNTPLIDMSTELNPKRHLTRILSWRIRDALARADIDAAITDVARIQTLSRLAGCTPTLINRLTAGAISAHAISGAVLVAEHPDLRPDQAARLAEIVGAINQPALSNSLRGERLVALDMIQTNLKTGIFVPSDSRAQMRRVEEMFDELDKQVTLTIEQRRADPAAIGVSDRWSKLEQLQYPTLMILEPALDKSMYATDQINLDHASAILAIAIIRFRLDHNGELPAALDALVPTYLATLPIDPYSGKPPIYVKGPLQLPIPASAPEAEPRVTVPFMLYSVGFDGVDNNAKVNFEPRAALVRTGKGLDFICYPQTRRN